MAIKSSIFVEQNKIKGVEIDVVKIQEKRNRIGQVDAYFNPLCGLGARRRRGRVGGGVQAWKKRVILVLMHSVFGGTVAVILMLLY